MVMLFYVVVVARELGVWHSVPKQPAVYASLTRVLSKYALCSSLLLTQQPSSMPSDQVSGMDRVLPSGSPVNILPCLPRSPTKSGSARQTHREFQASYAPGRSSHNLPRSAASIDSYSCVAWLTYILFLFSTSRHS